MSLTRRLINETAMGNVGCRIWDITGDTSYASGGYPTFKKGFAAGREILGIQAVAGNKQSASYGVQYDTVNDKLIFTTKDGTYPRGSNLTPGSLIVRETVTVTAASGAGQISRVPGYILTMRASAGGTTGGLRIIPVGETPATTQVAVNFTTGAIVCAAVDLVTAVIIQYIPLGVGPFIPANRVIDEAKTGVASTFNLTNRAAIVQYIWNDTGNNLPTIQPVGEAPGSGQIAIDVNNSAASTITLNAAQGTDNFKCTYWKFSGLGVDLGWIDDTDITITSDVLNTVEQLDQAGLFIPGYGNVIVGEATTTNKQVVMVDVGLAVGSLVAQYNPSGFGPVLTFNGSEVTTISVPYVTLNPGSYALGPGEVANGVNLDAVTMRVTIMSRGL